MLVGKIELILYIPDSHSLKEKRSVLKSIIRKVQNKFNAAIAEVDHQDKWQKSTLGIAVVGVDNAHVNSQVDTILNFIDRNYNYTLGECHVEIL
ncbi:hypothetical protein GGQ84_001771 [Desulfitispora alkaliphila]|uniref:DUF503 domain-containing protein n=1 Tax=Desulfitispora alkaliphila TaxID=622674 RepID=UPI003D1A09FE